MSAATPRAPGTALEKRRTKWQEATQRADTAEGALGELNQQLAVNAEKRNADKAELKAALKRTAELEKELRSLGKQRDRLRTERTRAKRGVKKARQRTRVTEAKFDRALLADMLRQARTAEVAKPSRTNGTAPRRRSNGSSAAAPRRTATANGRTAR